MMLVRISLVDNGACWTIIICQKKKVEQADTKWDK